ncbi:MAG: AAA family ATPase [Myxococcota bacterium]
MPGELKVRRRLPPYSDKPVLALSRAGQVLPFSYLSEGERTTIAMVADVARRLSLLSDTGDPLLEAASILVDEIEQHAHPAWQRQLVGELRRVFPNVQWVWTTHSPIVVQEVEPRQLRVLRDFRLVESRLGPGQDANGVLEDVFGQPARTVQVQQALDAVRDSIDDQDYAAAGAALEALSGLTAEGPDAVFFRTLLARIRTDRA